MEAQKTPRKRRAPRAWICENGERKPLEYVKSTDRLSAIGEIMRKQKPIEFTKAELRAILK